jgi:hypothetical protein
MHSLKHAAATTRSSMEQRLRNKITLARAAHHLSSSVVIRFFPLTPDHTSATPIGSQTVVPSTFSDLTYPAKTIICCFGWTKGCAPNEAPAMQIRPAPTELPSVEARGAPTHCRIGPVAKIRRLCPARYAFMARNSASGRHQQRRPWLIQGQGAQSGHFGNRTKQTILWSDALAAFAARMTEQKVVRVSAPIAKKIADPLV